MWRLWATVGAVVVVALSVAIAVAAVTMRDKGDTPVSHTPVPGPQLAHESALHEARLDLAQRLAVQPANVALAKIRAAGFDGCLGVYLPDTACTEQFIGGYIAMFEAKDTQYRYHFGGDHFIATDFQPKDARIDDGLEVPREIAPDFPAILAAFARHDAEIRTGAADNGAVVELLLPFVCPETADCVFETGSRAVARIATGQQVLLYELVPGDDPVTVVQDLPEWARAQDGMANLQERLRADLARRLGIDVSQVSMTAFRLVTWPDGCVGVDEPGKLCTQALVDGWLAKLTAAAKVYDYHGAGDPAADSDWVAASFLPGAIVSDGMPRRR